MIKGVLLDSGGVLIQPRGGRWNPRFDFEEVVLRYAPHITEAQFASAIAEGDQFLAACTETPDYAEIHRVILRALGLEASDALLTDLSRPVDPSRVVEVFDDVVPTLVTLRDRGIRLAVVSDAWSTLREMHGGLGIAHFFDAYAISQDVGCSKPDPRMFRTASDALGLEPRECFFVDDWPGHVAAAHKLGYDGANLLRDPAAEGNADVPVIRSLSELRCLLLDA